MKTQTKLPKNYLKLIELSDFNTRFPELGGVYGGKIKNELIIINSELDETHERMTFYHPYLAQNSGVQAGDTRVVFQIII